MDFELAPLPYPKHALEPYIGRETLVFHHEKHHAGYLRKLENLIGGKPVANHTLEEIIMISDDAVFENAAQVWNHEFYWHSMQPSGGGDPDGALRGAIERDLGSVDAFRKGFVEAGVQQFGSGWVWLVEQGGRLKLEATANADLPMTRGCNALLCADVWEHAYYLDFRDERKRYLETFLDHLVNWSAAAKRLEVIADKSPRRAAEITRLRSGGRR